MDRHTIIQAVIGLVTAAIVGVVSLLFSTVRDLEHSKDLQSVEIKHLRSEMTDLWSKYNKALDAQMEFMQLYYIDKVDIEQRICK